MLNRIIISGGGTGGHIFPAIAIANEIKLRNPKCAILFVGALGKMEMEKVPATGYSIVGLPIRGIQRKISFSNLVLPIKIIQSLWQAKNIIKQFKPQAVIGVGGYASAATLFVASKMNIPCLVQEQNSYAGITNKILSKMANKFCVAYDKMEQFFPFDKIVFTGNPVRNDIVESHQKNQKEEKIKLNFNPELPLVLVIGGSLGALTINKSIQAGLEQFKTQNIQLMWQTGKNYNPVNHTFEGIKSQAFINDMASVYAAADLVVSRAGALSISELCVIGKPVILVPSPNVAEDHQTKNALALIEKNAAILVKDQEASILLVEKIIELSKNKPLQMQLSQNISKLSKPEAVKQIVNEIEQLI